MTRHIKYLAVQGVVLIETAGSYHLGEEIETVNQAASMAIENNCFRIIFDCMKSDVTAKVMDSYDRPTIYEKAGFNRGPTKIAIVIKEINDNLVFYETVCMNRGWQVHLFTDYDKAMGWLTT